MSRKQYLLASLRRIESELLQVAKAGSREVMPLVARNLAGARDLCRQGVPDGNYAAYGEIYDGLILAAREMAEGKDRRLDRDALFLCRELLRHIIRETEWETSFKKDIFFLTCKASM